MGCYKNNSQGRIHKIWSSEEKTCWKWSSENWTKIKDFEESLKDNDDNQKWDQLYAYKEKINELVKEQSYAPGNNGMKRVKKFTIFFQLRKAKFEPEID